MPDAWVNSREVTHMVLGVRLNYVMPRPPYTFAANRPPHLPVAAAPTCHNKVVPPIARHGGNMPYLVKRVPS